MFKRKTSAIIAIVALFLALAAGAGWAVAYYTTPSSENSSGHNNEIAVDRGVELPVSTSNLNGTWIASDNVTTFTAEIANNSVSITMFRADTSMLYWYGWFDSTAVNGDTVVSNKLDINKAVLSTADSKNFIIGDNVVMFDFTAMGNTKVVVMIRA